ncbi:SRPBCC family protein [Amycolatopsis sp. FDAARGOS 1241]|uniref:SRPBCC family protein n=1 Tax=Amycolatopsis sp. FDAARGOS 1241 TaxID=2778070 RepID=UPI0019529DE8|nr:SRPBCC family protein [Amycolatopsis sp. FDAARGOS 1241]QRP44399.1 SRPBCC family protein [Amycolatopsis sp. FDAARGOS 1241]
MSVLNVHAREFPVPVAEAGRLLDDLTERLWPAEDWPPMEFAGPLAPGAEGGHGLVRYVVERFHAGRSLRCRFTAPQGIEGFHEFLVRGTATGCVLEHVLAAHLHGAARVTWPLFWRPLHDAVLEQLLDRAELALTGAIAEPARWSPYVRLLHAAGSVVVSRITGSRTQDPRVKLRA